MKSIRLGTIASHCGYTPDGVDKIALIDVEDFKGLLFEAGGLVSRILRAGDFAWIETRSDLSKVTSDPAGEGYAHTLETFVSGLASPLLSNLHTATKRRYVVVFRALSGGWFIFGQDTAGAVLTYKPTTSGGAGTAITLSALSLTPFLGIAASAILEAPYRVCFVPNFNYSDCLSNEGGAIPFQQAYLALAEAEPGGACVDAKGGLCAETGKLQAALLLEGKTAPATVEIVGTFAEKAIVEGFATVRYNSSACPITKRITVRGKISGGSIGCVGWEGVSVSLSGEAPTETNTNGEYSLSFDAEEGQEYELELTPNSGPAAYAYFEVTPGATIFECNGAVGIEYNPVTLRTGEPMPGGKWVNAEFTMPSNGDVTWQTHLRFAANGDCIVDTYTLATACAELENCYEEGNPPFTDPLFVRITIDSAIYVSEGFFPHEDMSQTFVVPLARV